ncbi:MAG: hypothetical protein U0975_05055 [Erythrobacter sp.]|nr:hypothetical protein [Erythrobacter sp.]MDZ4272023.1 hypothetical protein [Erythrobacter sp.]
MKHFFSNSASVVLLGLASTTSASNAEMAGSFEMMRAQGPTNVDYYIAHATSGPRPLVVVLQGSGCEPVFSVTNGNLQATAGQDIIHQLARQRFAVMIVQKPFVTEQSGTSGGQVSDICPPEFRRNHTLDNWAAAVSQAIDSAMLSGAVAPTEKVKLLGLSEGAIVAARLAALREDVSHVAFLSGFGCDQWSDMLVRTRIDSLRGEGTDSDRKSRSRQAVAELESGFAAVAQDPDNPDAYLEGQTHLFWSTFGRACPAQDLANSNADVLVYTGTDDEEIDANGIEAITASRLAARKPIRVERIYGGSHTLNTPDTNPFENLLAAFSDALDWMDHDK